MNLWPPFLAAVTVASVMTPLLFKLITYSTRASPLRSLSASLAYIALFIALMYTAISIAVAYI